MRPYLILLLVSILATSAFVFVHYEGKRRAYHASPAYSFLEAIKTNVQAKKWDEALVLIREGLLKKKLTAHSIKILRAQLKKSPFNEAYLATKAILKLKNTGLDFKTVFPIAFYKETHEVPLYVPESRFGRELQCDPESKSFFIHCGTHGTAALGKGCQKIVTRSILYDTSNPQVVARGLTDKNIQQEIEAMKTFTNEKGIISAIAFLRHKDPHSHKKMTAIVTPLYNMGSLEKTLKNRKLALTFQEKLGIAKDIISGLSSLHLKGYAHRDLGARNHFVSIQSPSQGNRVITCVIADLEKATHVRDLKGQGVQGNTAYLCPEGLFLDKMVGNMYFSSDLFAVGCLFWKLYFNKRPSWCTLSKKEFHLYDVTKLNRHYIDSIEKTRREASEILHTLQDPQKKGFLEIILQMTSSNPQERGTASEIKNRLFAL